MQYSWSMVRQLHKMTAAKVLDVLAGLRGSAGQAGDPVSALTQGRIQSALKLLESDCPDIWIRHPRYTWPVGWQNTEEPDFQPVRRQQGLFSSVHVGRHQKRQGRQRNLEPEEPTTFLDHVYVPSDAFNATANHVRTCIKWMHSVTAQMLHSQCNTALNPDLYIPVGTVLFLSHVKKHLHPTQRTP